MMGMSKSGPSQIPDEIWEVILGILRDRVEKKKEVSKKQLAAACGVSGPSVTRWFQGGRMTMKNATDALLFLGESPSKILGQYAQSAPWEAVARSHGFDPDHPRVREVYSMAFNLAMEQARQTINQGGPLGAAQTGEIRTG